MPVIRTIKRRLHHSWLDIRDVYYDVTIGIGNIFRWIPVIWDDIDWDWTSLARVMEYKLHRMSHLETTIGHHLTSRKDGRDMLICATLLRRLQRDNYVNDAHRFYGTFHAAVDVGMAVQRDDQKLLGKLLGRHMTAWWD